MPELLSPEGHARTGQGMSPGTEGQSEVGQGRGLRPRAHTEQLGKPAGTLQGTVPGAHSREKKKRNLVDGGAGDEWGQGGCS